MARLWDISQPIRPGVPTWPGDTVYQAERTWALEGDCPVNVSKITLSTHTGAHADAPLHYDANGKAIDAVDLARYLGPCRVVDLRGASGLIDPAHLGEAIEGCPPRVLLRTFERFPHDAWPTDFATPSPALIEALAERGVVLVGTDAPSMDPETSKTLDAHNAIRRRGLSILEGLVLDDVPAGDYELIALPLPFQGLDASPVRAVLRELAA
jgi:arylformamidase